MRMQNKFTSSLHILSHIMICVCEHDLPYEWVIKFET